ncbi:MAG: DUF4864 domain-containing protein [Rhodospirillales bacterium]
MSGFIRTLGLFVLLLMSPPAAAQGNPAASPVDAAAIRSVIERQLAAFQADDGDLAFTFASPKIRAMFGTSDNFMNMVRTGYQPVYRPRNAAFLDISIVRGQPTQRVLLTGPDGVEVIAHYFMERQADGTWLIDGCVLSEPEGAAV